jgi:membrane protease YdiL (CAAX protease family)
LLVSVPAEEIFYRGLVQRTLWGTPLGAGGAAVAVLVLYVLGNLPSRSLPIVAGAVVGGAVWERSRGGRAGSPRPLPAISFGRD